MLKSIIIIAGLCLAVPISGQKQLLSNGAPMNCVLNEKRPNPSNPYTFYYCRIEGPTLMKCPDGLMFDSSKLECAKHAAQHVNNVTVAMLSDSVSHGGSVPMLLGASGWSSPTSTTAAPPTGPATPCPPTDPQDEQATLLPYPGDCSKFFICSWGVPYAMDCPGVLCFNPTLRVCDYCEEAGCVTTKKTNVRDESSKKIA